MELTSVYACTAELYDILKARNALVKSVHCVTECTVFTPVVPETECLLCGTHWIVMYSSG